MDVYHCCETLFLEKCELMPGREQYTDQSADTIKPQLGNPSNFIWVTYRNMDEGVTYRRTYNLPKAHPGTSDSTSKLETPGAHNTTCEQLKRLKSAHCI